MKPSVALVSSALTLATLAPAAGADVDPGPEAFRAIYEELVEIDSSPSTGSCTTVVRAAERRLTAAGFTADELSIVIPEDRPEDGNLVARIRAAGAAKAGATSRATSPATSPA